MPDISEYREGNYIDYAGKQGNLPFCQIVKVNSNDDGTVKNYCLHKEGKDEFESYKNKERDEISPILLKPEHLKKLQFTADNENQYFSLAQLTIIYTGYPDSKEKTFYSARMYIVKPYPDLLNLEKKDNLEQFKKNTVEITNLHWFQNYCSDNGLKIDFSVFKV